MKKNNFLIFLSLVFFAAVAFYFLNNSFDKENKNEATISTIDTADKVLQNNSENSDICADHCSPISGLACDNYNNRPVMVMLSADEEARPLSGLADADMVIEMSVVEGGITRFGAVYVCNIPSEIGSIRSARHDFISLAKGLDAIFVHWGGSHFALDELAKGVIDDVDALVNPYSVFYRKSGIYAPHNGFTSGDRLQNGISKLGYRFANTFSGYQHTGESDSYFANFESSDKININYPQGFKVEYQYDSGRNAYLRKRNNIVEKDALQGKNIYAKIVIVMEASSRQLEGQYNDVDVIGGGEAQVFQNGKIIKGIWQKKDAGSKLYFLDKNGKEIKFLSGQIWVEIIKPENNLY